MKTMVFFAAIILCGFGLVFPQLNPGWVVFRGASFKVEYPPNFTLRTSLVNPTFADFYISAFFISPDKNAELYIYSFEGEGEATDIVLDTLTEVLVAKTKRVVKKPAKIIWRMTFKAKKGSYMRSYEDTEYAESGRLVFGIKYKDKKVYEKYKADYLKFKKSYAMESNIGD